MERKSTLVTVYKPRRFCIVTLRDILAFICAAAVPIAITFYSSIMKKDEQIRLEELRALERNQTYFARQHQLYDRFINTTYRLDKDEYLDDLKNPWPFANAYYRAAHRQWDTIRKADVLQFLKERQLIGRSNCSDDCGKKPINDIIRLLDLNFDYIRLMSQTGRDQSLKMDCVAFEYISLNGALFSSVNLNGAYFDGGRMRDAKFEGSSLTCVTFDGTDLRGVDFGNSNLKDVNFLNMDLRGVRLTPEQLNRARFYNSTLPNGTRIGLPRQSKFKCSI